MSMSKLAFVFCVLFYACLFTYLKLLFHVYDVVFSRLAMERSQIEEIRESARTELNYNRRAHRDEETDIRRHTESQNVTRDDIVNLANHLKSKSGVTAADICTLKNALADHSEYIEVVLHTQGTLRGLVRELTGQDAIRQIEAAGCLCNLVHEDDEHSSVAVVKNAGPYLVAALDSLNTELAITSAWTLGNAAYSLKAASLMTSQGAVPKLAALMTSHADDVTDAAAVALVQIARVLADDLKKEHAAQILQALSKTKLSSTPSQLLFILSCHDDFNELIDEEFLKNILEVSTAHMLVHNNRTGFVHLIRTLANVNLDDSVYNLIISNFSLKIDGLRSIIKMNIGPVNEALTWLFGNLYNYSSENEFFKLLLT